MWKGAGLAFWSPKPDHTLFAHLLDKERKKKKMPQITIPFDDKNKNKLIINWHFLNAAPMAI